MTIASHPPLRIALFGLPGAGKSTTAGLLREILAESGRGMDVVKIGAPLYDVQQYFHARAGSELAEGQQDGALLNFLGTHFRRTSPDFLLTDFGERCDRAVLAGADVLVCDDARPADFDGVLKQGFRAVRVTAPESERRQRKAVRGDKTAGSDDHPTEQGGASMAVDFEIDNSSDIAALRKRVADVVAELTAPGAQSGAAERSDDARRALRSLLEHTRGVIRGRYAENRHQIAASLLTADGRVFSGIHLEAMVGRASVCAEAVALGKAREAGATDLRYVLSVRHPKPSEAAREIKLVPPCGLCRELLLDYGQDLQVVLGGEDELRSESLSQMLPHKYVGTKWAAVDQSR